MKLDLDDLASKALAAEQDEWRWSGDERDVLEGVHNGQIVLYASEDSETREPMVTGSIADRAHIAAASPPVVLALIARIRELEAEVDRAAGLLEASSDRGARKVWAATLRETVAKGAVLP